MRRSKFRGELSHAREQSKKMRARFRRGTVFAWKFPGENSYAEQLTSLLNSGISTSPRGAGTRERAHGVKGPDIRGHQTHARAPDSLGCSEGAEGARADGD